MSYVVTKIPIGVSQGNNKTPSSSNFNSFGKASFGSINSEFCVTESSSSPFHIYETEDNDGYVIDSSEDVRQFVNDSSYSKHNNYFCELIEEKIGNYHSTSPDHTTEYPISIVKSSRTCNTYDLYKSYYREAIIGYTFGGFNGGSGYGLILDMLLSGGEKLPYTNNVSGYITDGTIPLHVDIDDPSFWLPYIVNKLCGYDDDPTVSESILDFECLGVTSLTSTWDYDVSNIINDNNNVSYYRQTTESDYTLGIALGESDCHAMIGKIDTSINKTASMGGGLFLREVALYVIARTSSGEIIYDTRSCNGKIIIPYNNTNGYVELNLDTTKNSYVGLCKLNDEDSSICTKYYYLYTENTSPIIDKITGTGLQKTLKGSCTMNINAFDSSLMFCNHVSTNFSSGLNYNDLSDYSYSGFSCDGEFSFIVAADSSANEGTTDIAQLYIIGAELIFEDTTSFSFQSEFNILGDCYLNSDYSSYVSGDLAYKPSTNLHAITYTSGNAQVERIFSFLASGCGYTNEYEYFDDRIGMAHISSPTADSSYYLKGAGASNTNYFFECTTFSKIAKNNSNLKILRKSGDTEEVHYNILLSGSSTIGYSDSVITEIHPCMTPYLSSSCTTYVFNDEIELYNEYVDLSGYDSSALSLYYFNMCLCDNNKNILNSDYLYSIIDPTYTPSGNVTDTSTRLGNTVNSMYLLHYIKGQIQISCSIDYENIKVNDYGCLSLKRYSAENPFESTYNNDYNKIEFYVYAKADDEAATEGGISIDETGDLCPLVVNTYLNDKVFSERTSNKYFYLKYDDNGISNYNYIKTLYPITISNYSYQTLPECLLSTTTLNNSAKWIDSSCLWGSYNSKDGDSNYKSHYTIKSYYTEVGFEGDTGSQIKILCCSDSSNDETTNVQLDGSYINYKKFKCKLYFKNDVPAMYVFDVMFAFGEQDGTTGKTAIDDSHSVITKYLSDIIPLNEYLVCLGNKTGFSDNPAFNFMQISSSTDNDIVNISDEFTFSNIINTSEEGDDITVQAIINMKTGSVFCVGDSALYDSDQIEKFSNMCLTDEYRIFNIKTISPSRSTVNGVTSYISNGDYERYLI